MTEKIQTPNIDSFKDPRDEEAITAAIRLVNDDFHRTHPIEPVAQQTPETPETQETQKRLPSNAKRVATAALITAGIVGGGAAGGHLLGEAWDAQVTHNQEVNKKAELLANEGASQIEDETLVPTASDLPPALK